MAALSIHPAVRALRIGVALLLFIHGVARIVNGVGPFGTWLNSLGFPWGAGLAWGITLVEILGTPWLAAGRFVPPLCGWFILQLLAGIWLVHAKAGWFVVGAGRNGVEYSVLLILCLGCLAWLHRKPAST
jgi:putative oxidoreductase